MDSIDIDVVPGETEAQRKERKKNMCKQLRQLQGTVALRKKEKEKAKATAAKSPEKDKAKTNKENKA